MLPIVKINKTLYQKYPNIPVKEKPIVIKRILKFCQRLPQKSYNMEHVVNMVCSAYIRHKYTDYDKFVTDENRTELKRQVGSKVKEILKNWEGENAH